eukprot:CAMPEP_0119319372 /NCGR_PEP_ID=MMETSP1333-20130426/49205_1 /TAXON_ID=418940 /ORGANISM="Scyphosphaera apsteinii, Strain RCC1455" /LENGTH=333 /DNA_ID=CAMNT_0007325759 /DNA_START=83 /DNA_END=1084 /DNA_ORIENTATION=+
MDDALKQAQDQLAELKQEALAKAESAAVSKGINVEDYAEAELGSVAAGVVAGVAAGVAAGRFSDSTVTYARDCFFMCGYGEIEFPSNIFDSSTCKCDVGFSGPCCDGPEVCSQDAAVMCGGSRYETKSFRCEDVSIEGPFSNEWSNFPKTLQGIFWLTNQGRSSALLSFGASRDGGGLSTGTMVDGEVNYEIRVTGDRVWSFMARTHMLLPSTIDLVYKFRLDNATNPTRGTIDPSSAALGISLGPSTEAILRFDVELVPFGECTGRGAECYPDSVTWARDSFVFGNSVGYYELVQVIDGEGNKLPAFQAFVDYCNDAEQTDGDGMIWYNEIV